MSNKAKKTETTSGGNEMIMTEEQLAEIRQQQDHAEAMSAYTQQAVVFLRETLEEQRQQAQKSAREVELLRREAHRKELSTLEMVAYLQKRMKQTETQSKQLATKLSNFLASEQQHLRNVERACATRIAQQQEVSESRLAAANDRITELTKELDALLEFRDNKDKMAKSLSDAQSQIEEMARDNELAIAKIERDHRAELARLKHDMVAQVNRINRISKENAERELAMESKRLRNDNLNLRDELRFHEQQTSDLLDENEKLRLTLKKARRELELSRDKDEHYAKRGAKQKKEIQELLIRVEQTERKLVTQTRKDSGKVERVELRLGHEIETYSNRVDQLKRALALKDKELNHVRSLASVIVSQRTETEKFFVDALAEVKAEIAAKRPPEPARKGKAGSKFPVLSKPAVLSCLPRRVELSDLSPEQRERVLTLLFKKMNQMKTTAQASSLPPHSFQASNTAHKQAFDDTQVVPPPYTPGLTFLTEQRPNV